MADSWEQENEPSISIIAGLCRLDEELQILQERLCTLELVNRLV
jgi:hypothetical protein